VQAEAGVGSRQNFVNKFIWCFRLDALAVLARSPGCMPGFAFVTCLTSRALLCATHDDSSALRPFCSHVRLQPRVVHSTQQLCKPWQTRAHGSKAAYATVAVPPTKARRQTVDYTLLAACVHEMQAWTPAKVEQVRCATRCHDLRCKLVRPVIPLLFYPLLFYLAHHAGGAVRPVRGLAATPHTGGQRFLAPVVGPIFSTHAPRRSAFTGRNVRGIQLWYMDAPSTVMHSAWPERCTALPFR